MTQQILFVDDTKDFVEYASKRLRARGYDVTTANCGEEALRVVEARDLDVVILDILMPGMNGVETLSAIKEIKPDLQVVMLTGHGTEESAERGMALGAFEYLLKPVEFGALLEVIGKAMEARGSDRCQENPSRAD